MSNIESYNTFSQKSFDHILFIKNHLPKMMIDSIQKKLILYKDRQNYLIENFNLCNQVLKIKSKFFSESNLLQEYQFNLLTEIEMINNYLNNNFLNVVKFLIYIKTSEYNKIIDISEPTEFYKLGKLILDDFANTSCLLKNKRILKWNKLDSKLSKEMIHSLYAAGVSLEDPKNNFNSKTIENFGYELNTYIEIVTNDI